MINLDVFETCLDNLYDNYDTWLFVENRKWITLYTRTKRCVIGFSSVDGSKENLLMNDNKVVSYGLWIGAINHLVSIVAVMFGCAMSAFTCQGDAMKNVLSIYAFTLLTPQIAIEAILILGLFLFTSGLRQLAENRSASLAFFSTLTLVVFIALLL